MTRLGPFELTEHLGRGGMGDVFRAREVETGRVVALKVLRSEVQLQGPQRERFIREARALARLRSPFIVSVHTAGEDQGKLYFAMDHVEGETLAEKLQRDGPLPIDEALRITRCLSEAIGHAHEQGVLHRDIKPGNVLITPEGTPQLLDFGLTRLVSEESRRLTRTGVMAGTLGFSPPEQVRDARQADLRADIYGLGATLYAMLTCRPPVDGPNVLAMVVNTTSGVIPPPSQLRPEVDARLDAVVMRMLARDPADRYASSAELRTDLDVYSSGSVPAASSARPRARGRPWWLPWTLLAAGLTALVVAAVTWRPPPPEPPGEPPAPKPAQPRVDPALLRIQARHAFDEKAPADELFDKLRAAREAAQDPEARAELQLLTARAAWRRCEVELGLQATERPAPAHRVELRYLRAALLRRDGQLAAARDVLRGLVATPGRWGLLAQAELELLNQPRQQEASPLQPKTLARLERELPDDPLALRLRLLESTYREPRPADRALERRVRSQAELRGDAALLLMTVEMHLGTHEQAKEAVAKAGQLVSERRRPAAWFAARARHRAMHDEMPQAIALMRKALAVRSRMGDVLTLGRWLEGAGQPAAALETYGGAYRRHGVGLLRMARDLPLELRILRAAATPIHSATTPLPAPVTAGIAARVAPLPEADRPAATALLAAGARGVAPGPLLEQLKQLRGSSAARARLAAEVLLSRDHFLEAEETLDRAETGGDGSLELKVLRCRIRLQAGDRAGARAALQALADADPRGWAGRAARAFLRLRDGDPAGATRHAEAALAERRAPFAYAASALALAGQREFVRAEVQAQSGFARTWYLDRWLAELCVQLATRLATARAEGSMGTVHDPVRNEQAFARYEELMRLTPHPRLRLTAARRLYEIPPGPRWGWHAASVAWLAEARAHLRTRDVPPRLNRVARERLQRELRAVNGMRLVLEYAPRKAVHEAWKGITTQELGLRFQQAYRSRFGRLPPPVEDR